MKMKSVFFGFSAKMALAVLAVGALTSCYEKEEVDKTPEIKPEPAKYYIQGNVLDVANGKSLDAKVTVDGVAVTVTNGYYRTEVAADKVVAVVADMDGYFTATKSAYLPATGAGTVSIATVDFALVGVDSQIVEPEAVNDPDEEETKALANNTLVDIFKNAGVIDSEDDFSIEVVDGGLIATAVKDLNIDSEASYTFQVPLTSGFASSIVPDNESIFTRALSDNDIWVKSAQTYLGFKYGMKQAFKDHTFQAVKGAAISTLILKAYYTTTALTFNGKEGVVLYQDRVVATVTYDDHDNHDGHDWHDAHDSHEFTSNPGAGGGTGK